MPVKVERSAVGRAEDACGFLVEHALRCQLRNRRYPIIRWAQLKQELWPESLLFVQRLIQKAPHPIVGHGDEGADEVAVIGDDVGVKVKNTPGSPRVNEPSFP